MSHNFIVRPSEWATEKGRLRISPIVICSYYACDSALLPIAALSSHFESQIWGEIFHHPFGYR
jgi:hypothetical protein